MKKKIEIDKVCEIAIKAGEIIMSIYQEADLGIETKTDESPVTKADLAANDYICSELGKIHSDIPILSEESKQLPFEQRKHWDCCFIVDPLDGTKEFIKRNGEFTVNIAYVENGNSVNGVVYAPALNVLYYTKDGKSFKRINGEENELPLDQSRSEYIVVASRSHLSSETKKFIDELEKIHKSVEIMNIGSSLKLCMIAEGAADCYPRLGPTMEWDIAAAQAVVEASGGSVLELHKKNKLTYNKENLLNPYFVVRSE